MHGDDVNALYDIHVAKHTGKESMEYHQQRKINLLR